MSTGAVIVTFNSAKTVRACIESLVREGVVDIVVVDSNSQDDTVSLVRGLPVRVVALDKNSGFGYAVNRGVELLNTNYVLFLNPDAMLTEGALGQLVALMGKSEKIGIVGSGLVDEQGVPEKHGFGKIITPISVITRQFLPYVPVGEIFAVDWVSGGAMLVQRRVFQNIGGFDEGYFLYWEDVDLCRRVKDMGFEVYIHLKARVIHARGASSLNTQKKTELYDASANRYFQKYYPPILWYLHRITRILYRKVRPLVQ